MKRSLGISNFLEEISILSHSDLHTDFSTGRSGGLVFPSLEELSTVYCDLHSQRLWHSQKAEIDVFLELSCFFHGPADVDNLISGSLPISKLEIYEE